MIPLSALNTIPVEQTQPGLLKVLLIPLGFAALLILRNFEIDDDVTAKEAVVED